MTTNVTDILNNIVFLHLNNSYCKVTLETISNDDKLENVIYILSYIDGKSISFRINYHHQKINLEFIKTEIKQLEDIAYLINPLIAGVKNYNTELLASFNLEQLKK